MSTMLQRGRIVILGLAGLAALAGGLSTSTLGGPRQDESRKPAGEAPPPADKLTRSIIGAGSCQGCHAHPENYRNQKEPLICRMTEYVTWDTEDKHKNALKVLADPGVNARAKRMGELLGIEDVAKSQACLSCHSVWIPDAPQQNFNAIAEGVTCVACHGAYQEWVARHQFPLDPQWRMLNRAKKQQDFGMYDLWNPVTRAQKCMSCHIGNAGESKIVTHAMYAAGHPPLPGVEVATFSDAEPRHWQYLKQKPQKIQDYLSYKEGRLEQTELVSVAGLVALRESIKLFVDQAAGNGLVKEPPTQWPDFARYDCYACHHDLQAPGWKGWRQERGFADAPGRPPAPSWPSALVQLGLEAADPSKAEVRTSELAKVLQDYHRAVGARPYGDKKEVADSAKALANWLDGVLGDFDKRTLDRAAALGLLRKLTQIAQSQTPDYDSARQMFWAFRIIYGEVDPKPAEGTKVPAILKDLDEKFGLSLRDAGKPKPIENTLGPRLNAVNDFDPRAFKVAFAELAGQLPQQ